MKAAVYKSYGPPEILKIEEVEKPAPGNDEVLVKILASSMNPVDWYRMIGLFIARLGNGLFKPKEIRLGTDYAGVVEAVGKDVTQFKSGDEVYGARSGAFAEYVCVSKFVFPSQLRFPSNKLAELPLQRSLPCKVSAIMDRFKRDKKF